MTIFWNGDFHKFLKGFLSPILSSTWKNVWKWSAKNKFVVKILLNLKDDILLEKYFLCLSIELYISKQVISIPQPQEPFYPLNTFSFPIFQLSFNTTSLSTKYIQPKNVEDFNPVVLRQKIKHRIIGIYFEIFTILVAKPCVHS